MVEFPTDNRDTQVRILCPLPEEYDDLHRKTKVIQEKTKRGKITHIEGEDVMTEDFLTNKEEKSEDDIKKEKFINSLTPKYRFKYGIDNEYTPGLTKQTLEKRKQRNRKKNKQAKQMRKNRHVK